MECMVSIVIPAYNAAKWIEHTILSALDQTWKRKEIIVVDDGSKDNTREIVQKFDRHGVKLLVQKNKGSSAARNYGLKVAQGDFIQFLDHDDLLDPDKIRIQLAGRNKHANTGILLVSEFAVFRRDIKQAHFYPGPLWRDLTPKEYFHIKFRYNTWMHPSCFLISRRLMEKAGPWLEIRSPDDDGEYFCRVVAACERIEFTPGAKSYWRVGRYNSLSRNRSREVLEGLFITNQKCIEHFLSLEDTSGSRLSCVKFLEDRLQWFLPERPDLVEATKTLARNLGREISLPKLKLKYLVFERIFGTQAAYSIMRYMQSLKGKLAGTRYPITGP